MQVLMDNTKNGELSLLIESLDDLWILYNIIQPHDRVRARTLRRVVLKEGDSGDRKPMMLTLNVEKVEFHEFTNHLRVLGTILEGPDDFVAIGQHHTFNLETSEKVQIFKDEWFRSDIERIRKNIMRKDNIMILAIAIESGLANLALLSNYSLTPISEINENIPGKRYDKQFYKEAVAAFFSNVNTVVMENLERHKILLVIICGPGFTKEQYLENLREILSKTKFETELRTITASSGELSSIYEILRNGTVASLNADFKVAQDELLMGEFVTRLGKNTGTIAYGLKEVQMAVEMGAVEKILICDLLLRTNDKQTRVLIDTILNDTEKNRGEVHILSTANPAGDQLKSYGEIAALLRYRIKIAEDGDNV
jgi:protein pelota